MADGLAVNVLKQPTQLIVQLVGLPNKPESKQSRHSTPHTTLGSTPYPWSYFKLGILLWMKTYVPTLSFWNRIMLENCAFFISTYGREGGGAEGGETSQ